MSNESANNTAANDGYRNATAREHALVGEKAFLENRLDDSYGSLRKCWEYLEQGNKAHQRRAAFVAGADGQVVPVSAATKGEPARGGNRR